MKNKGLEKLKIANKAVKAIREKAGYNIVKVPAKKVFILPRQKAVSIASGRLFSKNIPNTLDGIDSFAKINKLATTLQKEKGYKTIKETTKKVYKISQQQATKKYWSSKKETGKQLTLELKGTKANAKKSTVKKDTDVRGHKGFIIVYPDGTSSAKLFKNKEDAEFSAKKHDFISKNGISAWIKNRKKVK